MGFILLVLVVIGLAVPLVELARMRQRMERLEGEVAALRAALEKGRRLEPAPYPVFPAEAGTSGQEVSADLHETQAFAGVMKHSMDAASSRPESADTTIAGLFERLVGGRLLIWVGGIALAAAGIFLIRHSIERLTPEARMIGSALLGLILIAGGEYARRGRLFADDPRIAQALVGAGLAVIYATAYGSHLLFGLIGGGTAAILMMLITGAALALSLRHGAPTAALGLAGGFATPLLVGDPDAGALPVLAYLALLDLAVFAIAWRRGWGWLAAAAVAASFAWTGWFVLNRAVDAWPAGLFAAALGVAASLPRREEERLLGYLQPVTIALVQAAVLAGRDDIGAAAWLLFAALGVASLVLAALRPAYRLAPAAALALALLLIAIGADTDPWAPWAAAIATALFGSGAAVLAGRGQRLQSLTACGGLAGPLLILRLVRPDLLGPGLYGALACLAAAAALGLLLLLRARAGRRQIGALAASGTAALLLAVGAVDLLPRDLVTAGWLATAIALLLPGVRMGEEALRLAGLGLLTAAVLKAFLFDASELEGVLRILSFLALGLALIGIGMLYSKVLRRSDGGKSGSVRSG